MNNQIPQFLTRKPDDNYTQPVKNSPVTLQDFLNGAAVVVSVAMAALEAYSRLRGGNGIRR